MVVMESELCPPPIQLRAGSAPGHTSSFLLDFSPFLFVTPRSSLLPSRSSSFLPIPPSFLLVPTRSSSFLFVPPSFLPVPTSFLLVPPRSYLIPTRSYLFLLVPPHSYLFLLLVIANSKLPAIPVKGNPSFMYL